VHLTRIKLATYPFQKQQLRAESSQFQLAAGMQLSAEIVEGRRTVLEYLLSPVQRVSHETAMGR
jgi:HlyD family secretion protein